MTRNERIEIFQPVRCVENKEKARLVDGVEAFTLAHAQVSTSNHIPRFTTLANKPPKGATSEANSAIAMPWN